MKQSQLSQLVEIPSNTGIYDIILGATWDKKDWPFVEKSFRYFNNKYWIIKEIGRTIRAQFDNPILYKYWKGKLNEVRNELMPHIHSFDERITRKFNDQSPLDNVEPIQSEIGKDLVTVRGLQTIVDNFMLLDVVKYTALATGTGGSTPFGGDMALQAQNAEVSIEDEGFAISYGTEARHGCPFPASLATANVKEVGIKSVLGLTFDLYSRSMFPSNKVIAHANMQDIYTIQHISFFKST
jgi:hypothetical protein